MAINTPAPVNRKTAFENWKREACRPFVTWKIDGVHDGKSGRELFIYRGDRSGYFISVDPDGMVRVGGYEDAVPHISDGLFKTAVEYKCENFQEGVERILSACGLDMTIGLFE
jgi:hypothetical protein